MAPMLCALFIVGAAGVGQALSGSAAKPAGTYNGCPIGLVPVPAAYRTEGRRAAATFLHTTYARWDRLHHWGVRPAGAQIGSPILVRHWLPSGWVKEECGQTVWLRSVAVGIRFPAMEYPNPIGPCNACAHIVLLLGRTRRGWIIWGNY